MRFIMCEPTYFDVVNFTLNPYMKGNRPVNKVKAKRQWRQLVSILELSGVNVILTPPVRGLPDMVFSANGGSVVDNYFYPSNFKVEPRKLETLFYTKRLQQLGYHIKHINGIFEGQGDTQLSKLTNRGLHIWVGYGHRTDLSGANNFIQQLPDKITVHILHLVDPYFYHLDTCLLVFGNKYALYYPGAFSRESNQKLKNIFDRHDIITVTREEALNFSCNSIEIPDISGKYQGIILANQLSPRLRNKLQQLNYGYLECPMSEFILAGGSTRCCVLKLS